MKKVDLLPDKPKKEKVSLTIDGGLLPKLMSFAQEDDRSLSSYINLVLRNHVIQRELRESRADQSPEEAKHTHRAAGMVAENKPYSV